MRDRLYRCFDFRDKFFLFTDLAVTDPEFPDYLKMIQIGGWEHYELTQSTGVSCVKTHEFIYEKDIVQYQGAIYRVVYLAPGFVLEHLSGRYFDLVDCKNVEKIGSGY